MVKRFGMLIMGIIIGAGLTLTSGAFAAVSDQVQAVFRDLSIVVNGEKAELDSRPLSYNGTTYLPVREVANLTGYDVTYKADSATIVLESNTVSESTASLSKIAPVSESVSKVPDGYISLRDAASKGVTLTSSKEGTYVASTSDKSKRFEYNSLVSSGVIVVYNGLSYISEEWINQNF